MSHGKQEGKFSPKDKKPSLYQLRLEHRVNIYDLTQASDVDSSVVWSMLLGHKVSKQDAKKILDGFNKLKGTQYRLEDIDVGLIEGDENTTAK